MVKNSPANGGDIRDAGLIPRLGRSLGGGHGNPLQYSCLENPHGQRSLACYSPWACKEWEMTKHKSIKKKKKLSCHSYPPAYFMCQSYGVTLVFASTPCFLPLCAGSAGLLRPQMPLPLPYQLIIPNAQLKCHFLHVQSCCLLAGH